MTDLTETPRDLVDTVTIVLPFPDMNLSANNIKRRHWSKNRKFSKVARELACVLAAQQVAEKVNAETINVHLRFHQPDAIKRNRDNIVTAFKSYQDGVADALNIPDERWNVTYSFGDIVKGGKVVLEITEGNN